MRVLSAAWGALTVLPLTQGLFAQGAGEAAKTVPVIVNKFRVNPGASPLSRK